MVLSPPQPTQLIIIIVIVVNTWHVFRFFSLFSGRELVTGLCLPTQHRRVGQSSTCLPHTQQFCLYSCPRIDTGLLFISLSQPTPPCRPCVEMFPSRTAALSPQRADSNCGYSGHGQQPLSVLRSYASSHMAVLSPQRTDSNCYFS